VQLVKDKTVLEIGCGEGFGASYLLSKGAKKVIAGDISENEIRYAKECYQRDGMQFVFLDAQDLEFANNSFDVIVAFEVIEHLGKYLDFLDECRRVLRDNGTFICSTPSKEIMSPKADKPWFPGHVREFDIDEFRTLLSTYFQEVVLYGVCPGSKAPGMIDKLIYSPKLGALRFLKPAGIIKIINIITRFVFQRYRLVALEEIDEKELDRIADERYHPFLIQVGASSPSGLIAVARK
jgi:ubiquinone/menaquinone biosynthesis C-methylase UbiE